MKKRRKEERASSLHLWGLESEKVGKDPLISSEAVCVFLNGFHFRDSACLKDSIWI